MQRRETVKQQKVQFLEICVGRFFDHNAVREELCLQKADGKAIASDTAG